MKHDLNPLQVILVMVFVWIAMTVLMGSVIVCGCVSLAVWVFNAPGRMVRGCK